MDKGRKRSFEEKGATTVDEYVYSASDRLNLENLIFERPQFRQTYKKKLLSINVKMAALQASSFVVSLLSFSGEDVLSQSCGTIIEAHENHNVVITSLNLIRKPSKSDFVENSLADNFKIVVRSSENRSYIGEVEICDFHYNLLIIKFKSMTNLQPAKLAMIDDDVGLATSFELLPHSVKVRPGAQVMVLGRYFYTLFDVMAAPGCFSMDRRDHSDYDCRELLSASCDITRCGDGGALVNLSGEVVGIIYYENAATCPFLPINVAYKWWSHYVKYRELRHPSYGFDASNLYLACLPMLARIVSNFPNISSGVLVEKILPGSNAESAGLLEDDVIVKCDGITIKSFFELWDLMWDKVGSVVKLEVARVDPCSLLTINMVVTEAMPKEMNKWPRYDYC